MVPPFIGHTLSKVWVICVLVSQVFVFFGVFSTELLPLPCKITEVGRLSLFIEFFVGFHIVCDRYTLDNAHFTYFNTIWPLSLSSTFGTAFITGSHSVISGCPCMGGSKTLHACLCRIAAMGSLSPKWPAADITSLTLADTARHAQIHNTCLPQHQGSNCWHLSSCKDSVGWSKGAATCVTKEDMSHYDSGRMSWPEV